MHTDSPGSGSSLAAVGLVFAGGAAGSLVRYLVGVALPALWPVFVVNVLGSLMLGLLLGSAPSRSVRLLIGTGFLGGFTTYSAFAVEVASLGVVGGPVIGLAFGLGQAAFGAVAALLGFALADVRRARPEVSA